MQIDVTWTGGYPTLCFGKWKIIIDGIELTGLDSQEFNTAGTYDTWHFEDCDDVWEIYRDGLYFDAWYKTLLEQDTNGLKSSLIRHGFDVENKAFIEDLYNKINAKDWRHNSCGGCI
ncbi:hypothetical protein [Providencia phage PSTRCR_121]|nr:hypothetical protein [Providencia phage PSTRCR_121]